MVCQALCPYSGDRRMSWLLFSTAGSLQSTRGDRSIQTTTVQCAKSSATANIWSLFIVTLFSLFLFLRAPCFSSPL